MQSQKIRIRLKAFDYRLIDQSALEIVETAKRLRTEWKASGTPMEERFVQLVARIADKYRAS